MPQLSSKRFLPCKSEYGTILPNQNRQVSPLKNKQNLHIHSTFSDGKHTPEEIVLEAIDRGFASIGFSEHSYMPFSPNPHQMTVPKTEDYKKEIRALKEKYRGVLDVFLGLEFELHSDLPPEDFDYLIGSVHYLNFDGRILGFDRGFDETLAYIRENFSSDGLAFAKKYFETVAKLPEKRKFDIIGHFDLITKNNEKGGFIDTTSKKYLDMGYEAIHAMKGKIPFFEVNTGAIARGYRTSPYPDKEFLREFLNCGFGAVITSDCHDKRFLDCHFEQARELLSSVGFSSRFILTDNGFVEVEL